MIETKMILTAGPSVTQKEIDYVTDAITNGHGEHWGDYIKQFEKSFAKYIGVKHALATSSCTGALHLGLVALGIGKGDEVIVPDLTWIASASTVAYTGATPVFAEVLADNGCIDASLIEDVITERTKAIMPVHLYGHPADMIEILRVAKIYGLKVIEDAAPSVGSAISYRRTGSFGDVAGFSFQGAKMLSTGEGGMIVTDNDELFEKIKHFSEHGRSGSGFEITDIGFKYKMTNLQAAWGLAQLERVNELLIKKAQIYEWYKENLKDIKGICLSENDSSTFQSNHWMTSILVDSDKISRDDFRKRLYEKMIDTRPYFPCLSSFKMFPHYWEHPVAATLSRDGVNLPSGHNLSQDDIEYICDCIKEILMYE